MANSRAVGSIKLEFTGNDTVSTSVAVENVANADMVTLVESFMEALDLSREDMLTLIARVEAKKLINRFFGATSLNCDECPKKDACTVKGTEDKICR